MATNSKFEMSLIDVRADEAVWPDLCDLENHIAAEARQGEPALSVDEYALFCHSIAPEVERYVWLVRDVASGTPIARAAMAFDRDGAERPPETYAWFALDVLPDCRRLGIGRYLLAEVRDCALREGCNELRTETSGSIPAGAAFLEGIGAKKFYEGRMTQLDLHADLNPNLLRQWADGNPDFDIAFYERPLEEAAFEIMDRLDDAIFAHPAPPEAGEQAEQDEDVRARRTARGRENEA